MNIKRIFSVVNFGMFALLILLPCIATGENRTVSINTQEITRPDVAVSPDGEWLVVTSLGHLFRLPQSGGKATQLTFGPWFDSEPAISPDGKYIVFASDRDGKTNGSLFVLEVGSGEIRQLTNGEWASRPAWSPDSNNIVYLSYEQQGMWSEYEFINYYNGVSQCV